jgi:dTMP kinase
MKRRRGLFIALEGIDGSGTTTQTRALAAALAARGAPCHLTCEPSRGPIGRMIREQLSASDPIDAATLALLFAADRLDHLRREVHPAVDAGAIVISDRYVLSSLVYQSLDCEPSWVATLNQRAAAPDLCVLLDLPVELAVARVRARLTAGDAPEERYDAPELQRRLAAAYREHAARDPRITIIDGARPPESVTADLLARITPLLDELAVAFG